MTLGKFLDNLIKGGPDVAHRAIPFGRTIICEWKGSENGYLIASIHYGEGSGPMIIRYDGLRGNPDDVETLRPDVKDGKVEIATYDEFVPGGPVILFPRGTYVLKVEGSDDINTMVPEFKDIQFDII